MAPSVTLFHLPPYPSQNAIATVEASLSLRLVPSCHGTAAAVQVVGSTGRWSRLGGAGILFATAGDEEWFDVLFQPLQGVECNLISNVLARKHAFLALGDDAEATRTHLGDAFERSASPIGGETFVGVRSQLST